MSEVGGRNSEGSEASKAFQNALDLLRNKPGEKGEDKNVPKPVEKSEQLSARSSYQKAEQLAFNARLAKMLKDGDLDGAERAIAERNKDLGKV